MWRFEAKEILFYLLINKKMKKLVLLLAVVFSVSLFSCGGSDKAAEATDSVAADTVEVVETAVEVVDSAAADSVVADTVAVAVEAAN